MIRIIIASSHVLNTFVTDRQTDRDEQTDVQRRRQTEELLQLQLPHFAIASRKQRRKQTGTDRTTAIILLLGNTAAVQPSSLAPRSGFPPNQLEGLWGCCKLHHSGLAVNDFLFIFSSETKISNTLYIKHKTNMHNYKLVLQMQFQLRPITQLNKSTCLKELKANLIAMIW